MSDRSFSLVTLSRNRPVFIRRMLQYYKSCELRAPIIIADGSDLSEESETARVVESFSTELPVTHLKLGPSVPAFERLRRAVGVVASPYVVWVGDDDFFIPGRIEDAVDLLESRTDVSAVAGLSLMFNVEGDGPSGRIRSIAQYGQRACMESDPLERVRRHVRNLHSTAYSVRRTALALQNLTRVAACGWEDNHFHFAELLESVLTVTAGRFALLRRLTTVRQSHRQQSSSAGVTGRRVFDLLVDGSWQHYPRPFLEATERAFVEHAGMTSAAATAASRLVLNESIASTLSRDLRPGKPRRSLGGRILNRMLVLAVIRGLDAVEFSRIRAVVSP